MSDQNFLPFIFYGSIMLNQLHQARKNCKYFVAFREWELYTGWIQWSTDRSGPDDEAVVGEELSGPTLSVKLPGFNLYSPSLRALPSSVCLQIILFFIPEI